jgi:cyclopropane-fatty-acyl-phospholipid synthase
MAFRYDGEVVFQLQIAKQQQTLPLTRDYILEDERAMRFADGEAVLRPLRRTI